MVLSMFQGPLPDYLAPITSTLYGEACRACSVFTRACAYSSCILRSIANVKYALVNLQQMPHYLHPGGGSARKKTRSGSLSALVNNYYSLCPWTHCRAAAIINAPASSIFCTIVIFRVSPPQCSLAFQVKSLVTSRCHLGRKLLAAMQLCANGCLNKSKLAASCMPKTKKP